MLPQLQNTKNDFPDIPCKHLYQRKSVTHVKLADNNVQQRIKAHILEHNPTAASEVLYMCNYYKPLVRKDQLPARCVLNGFELTKLDSLSRQLSLAC